MMDSSCLFYICLVSCLHCLVVTWLAVALEYHSTDMFDNSTTTPENSSFTNPGNTEHYHTTENTGAEQNTTHLKNENDSSTDNVTTLADYVTSSIDGTSKSARVTAKGYVTTEGYVSQQTTVRSLTSTVKSILNFMPACPPPNNLHQLCNVSLGNLTCSERAIIVKVCYNKHTAIYSNSSWNICDKCEDIITFLSNKNLINKTIIPVTTDEQYQTDVTTVNEDMFTGKMTEYWSGKTTASNKQNANHSNVKETSTETDESNKGITPDVTYSLVSVSKTISSSPSTPVTGGSNSRDFHPNDPLSWLYPLIGCAFILLEVILLWYFCWYRQKKYSSTPPGRYRRASTGSMVIQEDLIEPESTSPTKALYMNQEFDNDSAMNEDEKIFNSYLNLRFIDDSSMEGTPHRFRAQ